MEYESPPDASASLPASLSPGAPLFTPQGLDRWRLGFQLDAERQFARCAAKIRSLNAGSGQLREELNLLFDQLLSEKYNTPNISIGTEDVCALLKHACSLVPLKQEHLVIKFCQLANHLLNQLTVVIDEQTSDVLVKYTVKALRRCDTWTHSDILLALSTVVFGNGSQCLQHLGEFLGEDGLLLTYSSTSQPNMDLQLCALKCLTNICVRLPGQLPLDDEHRSVFFQVFLKTLQSPKPPQADELVYCLITKRALKGLQCCLSGGKWIFGEGEELGSVLAVLKRLMFHGAPGVNVDWALVLYPAPLPQFEAPAALKPPEPPIEAAAPCKASRKKKKKPRGRGRKTGTEESSEEEEEDEMEEVSALLHRGGRRAAGKDAESRPKPSAASLLPSLRTVSSDSEISDMEGNAQSGLSSHYSVSQRALLCLLAVVKVVERRTLYGYWSSFIPDSSMERLPPLSLLTIVLKAPSPRVRAGALQVLMALLYGSCGFLAVAEDTASPPTSYTPFSYTLATSVREMHRVLSLALLAETSIQMVTQVIKCLGLLVANSPYRRLKPGLLSGLIRKVHPYMHHRDVTVRVSVLSLFSAMVTTHASLPEVQLLLQQPVSSSSGGGSGSGSSQDNWRQRDGVSSPCHTPSAHGSYANSPRVAHTPVEEAAAAAHATWLLPMSVALVTQPREDQSGSEGSGTCGGVALEQLPVRVQALQILCQLVRCCFPLAQSHLCELGQLSADCLRETEAPIRLYAAKLLYELGNSIVQQYRCAPESKRVPLSQVVRFWSDALSGPLNTVMQNEQQPNMQMTACNILASILPQAFAELPEKTQLMCVTVLLGLNYSENTMVKMAAVRGLGLYIMFPCLTEDVMFMADTANTVLSTLKDSSPNVRIKACWALANLTDALVVTMESGAVDFQEEPSDTLLLKMLQAAIKGLTDKNMVKFNAVRVIGNLLRFLRRSQLTHATFQGPVEEAARGLPKTIQTESCSMKVLWNACYALGKAFRNPDLQLDSALWAADAFSALCYAVTSIKNLKVQIKSAAALNVPAQRRYYGDTERFMSVWNSLALALENSEDTGSFVGYNYYFSLRRTLAEALLHLLSLSQAQDMDALGTSVAGERGRTIRGYVIKYLREEEEGAEEADGEKDERKKCVDPQQRMEALQQNVNRLKSLEAEGEQSGKKTVVDFLEDVLRSCEE
ncbi:HEAT repeat-containing protein 6 [Genypterus blacodes]|uniref:HEAT repeat-containing protein 6 n=1 Tax=Genypterus blacodes TaxID=154954 RepID=UPI003F778296